MNNSGNEDQRWRSSNHRGQGQRRNMPRDGNSYAGQGYNQNSASNGNSNAWGSGMMGGHHHHHHHHHHHNNHHHHPQQHHQQHHQQHPHHQPNAGYHEVHVPVNGFNQPEAQELLTRAYDFQVQAARAPPGVDGDRPIIYKGDKGWSTPKGSNNAWGQKRNAMATGSDFLAQLKKSHASMLQNSGRE